MAHARTQQKCLRALAGLLAPLGERIKVRGLPDETRRDEEFPAKWLQMPLAAARQDGYTSPMRFPRQLAMLTVSWMLAHTLVAADYDLVIYGGTASGVITAVQAKKMGKSVIIVCPDKHLGGLSSGGLGFTDTGNKAVIGGLSRDFYHRVWKHYDQSDAWKWQKRDEYGNKGQGTPAIDGEQRTMWIFEPH